MATGADQLDYKILSEYDTWPADDLKNLSALWLWHTQKFGPSCPNWYPAFSKTFSEFVRMLLAASICIIGGPMGDSQSRGVIFGT